MANSDETTDRTGQAYRRRVSEKVREATREFRRAFRPVWDRFRFARQDLTAATPTLPRVAYLFISPFFLLFSVFLAFPVFYTLYLSFFEYQGVGQGSLFWIDLGPLYIEIPRIAQLEFVALGNYARLFGNDLFWQSMFNTSYILVIQVPLMIGLALALALALNASFMRLKGVFRTAIALPVSANLVAYSTVFLLLFNEQLGFLNYVLAGVGLGPVPWLTDGFWARNTIIAAVTWRWTGYNMIILLAGLQTIPQQLYEAAEIDGANRWEKFRYVTLPQLKPVLLFVVVLSTIGTFKLFAEPYVITGGGPTNSTITIVQYIYRQAFINFNLGYASALTVVFVAIVSVFSVVQIKIGGED
ncbi:carbohydrate ABC transporter permease [Halorubrum tropicale]|jgi:multiple sugar transport system permease protein/lactose/L-arabinose transport system permease protein|uniref:ABC transporter permease n=1 Tax=Halorubrum tropicale TaxID=1765655 RepID=A0A0N0U9B8_9EURY|nr:ABC transporter permease [Halorubrum tropicale]TKX42836.1 sugar ABC transporter permease [Halorubrum sp. ARQ200]TKX59866.1 sugar ABC transporter permease [Halorubrum sp. ASP1]